MMIPSWVMLALVCSAQAEETKGLALRLELLDGNPALAQRFRVRMSLVNESDKDIEFTWTDWTFWRKVLVSRDGKNFEPGWSAHSGFLESTGVLKAGQSDSIDCVLFLLGNEKGELAPILNGKLVLKAMVPIGKKGLESKPLEITPTKADTTLVASLSQGALGLLVGASWDNKFAAEVEAALAKHPDAPKPRAFGIK
jgi:hypothetical protein